MKRHIHILCIILAIMIIAVAVPTATYSWFEPGVKEGIPLSFKDETNLRAQNCTIQTFSGTKGNKITTYETSAVGTSDVTLTATSSTVTNEDGTTSTVYTPDYAYYKTVITNSSEDYDTVVSLFIPSFTPADNSNASICVAYPTNSVRTYAEEQTDLHIIRNAFVSKYVTTDSNPGQLIVEWFVRCDAGSVTFNPSEVFLMYS